MNDRVGAAARAIFVRCKNDPWWWLVHCVQTHDAHDLAAPRKRFPAYPYLREITKVWLAEPMILIPKSRQMMVTWLVVALYVHDAAFHRGRCIFFQSKQFSDAADLLDRARIVYDGQPRFLRELLGKLKGSRRELLFSRTKSFIRGIAQGGDKIRMQTASGIFMDEAGYMWQCAEAFTASKPSIMGGGRITMVSSANPGFFQSLCDAEVA